MGKYQRIKDLREDLDLTQESIAKTLNMHKTQYQRYENSDYNSFFEAMILIANFHKVSLDYLAGRTNDKRGLTRSELSSFDTELLKKIHALTDEQRGIIIGRIEAMTEENEETAAKMKGAI